MKNLYLTAFLLALLSTKAHAYKVGVGRADCTGPPVEIRFVSKMEIIKKN